jgi:hypothetical protein
MLNSMNAHWILPPTCICVSAIPLVAADGVFTVQSVEQGKASARDSRVFLVLVARINDPLVQNDGRVWGDERVKAWIAAHGSAMHFKSEGELDALKELDAYAPAVIAFREGVECDRDTRFATADDLIEWLGQVERG